MTTNGMNVRSEMNEFSNLDGVESGDDQRPLVLPKQSASTFFDILAVIKLNVFEIIMNTDDANNNSNNNNNDDIIKII